MWRTRQIKYKIAEQSTKKLLFELEDKLKTSLKKGQEEKCGYTEKSTRICSILKTNIFIVSARNNTTMLVQVIANDKATTRITDFTK